MAKTVNFYPDGKDKDLVKNIEKYQKDKKHKSFVDAVRDLCDTALTIEKIKRK